MRRVVWSIIFWVAASPAFAQDTTFNPAPKDVCVPAHAGGYVVDRKRLIARLVQVQAGIPAIDLRPDGQAVTLAMQVEALLRPEAFCTIHGCSKPTVEKLRQAYFVLMEFLVVNSGAGTKSFRLIGSNNPNDFLGAPEGTLDILCVTPPKQQQAKPDDFGKPEIVKPRSFFAVRKNVEDLVYAQTDQQFKKLERANLSFKQDYEEDNESVGVDGVAGYTYGPAALGRSEIRLSPFISYKQDYANKAGIANDTGVFNLGGGVSADWLFPIGRTYHDLQLYPKYVHSLRDDADTLVTTLALTPGLPWRYFGHASYVIPNVLSAQFTPQIKAAEGAVFDAGSDPESLEKGNYFRWGPKIALAMFGEAKLKGFVFNLSYEIYDVYNAKISSLERFEASIDYTIGEKELWALQLKYVDGQDLDTWEDQQQLTLGAGLKY